MTKTRSLKSFNCDHRLSSAVGAYTQKLRAGGARRTSESLVIEAAIVAFLMKRVGGVDDPHLQDYLADEADRVNRVKEMARL